MAIKTFTSGEVLNAADTNTYLTNSGLVYVTSATVGAGVTSATVSNCFSSTYDDYRITVSAITNTAASVDLTLQLTSITGSVYAYSGYYQLTGAGAMTTFGTTSTNQPFGSLNGTLNSRAICEISSPNLAKAKYTIVDTASAFLVSRLGSQINSTVQSTGFTIAVASGTISAGTITVYGYRKA